MSNDIVLNTQSERGKLLAFRLHINQLLGKGEVHYIDLSNETDRFYGLSPKCHTYGNDDEFSTFLSRLHQDMKERLARIETGDELNGLPHVSVVIMGMPDETYARYFQSAVLPYFQFNRAIKYVFYLKGIDTQKNE